MKHTNTLVHRAILELQKFKIYAKVRCIVLELASCIYKLYCMLKYSLLLFFVTKVLLISYTEVTRYITSLQGKVILLCVMCYFSNVLVIKSNYSLYITSQLQISNALCYSVTTKSNNIT